MGPKSPEKWESLAWGPDLRDGRRQLIVVVDHDYVPEAPTMFAAFAIDRTMLQSDTYEMVSKSASPTRFQTPAGRRLPPVLARPSTAMPAAAWCDTSPINLATIRRHVPAFLGSLALCC